VASSSPVYVTRKVFPGVGHKFPGLFLRIVTPAMKPFQKYLLSYVYVLRTFLIRDLPTFLFCDMCILVILKPSLGRLIFYIPLSGKKLVLILGLG